MNDEEKQTLETLKIQMELAKAAFEGIGHSLYAQASINQETSRILLDIKRLFTRVDARLNNLEQRARLYDLGTDKMNKC